MDMLIGKGAGFVRNKNGLSCVYLYVCSYAYMHIYMYATIIIKKRVVRLEGVGMGYIGGRELVGAEGSTRKRKLM